MNDQEMHISDCSEARDLNECLSGKYVYGNDFNSEEIQRWYEDEREAYADISSKDHSSYQYGYARGELNSRILEK